MKGGREKEGGRWAREEEQEEEERLEGEGGMGCLSYPSGHYLRLTCVGWCAYVCKCSWRD